MILPISPSLKAYFRTDWIVGISKGGRYFLKAITDLLTQFQQFNRRTSRGGFGGFGGNFLKLSVGLISFSASLKNSQPFNSRGGFGVFGANFLKLFI
jgi:hypothetical protein